MCDALKNVNLKKYSFTLPRQSPRAPPHDLAGAMQSDESDGPDSEIEPGDDDEHDMDLVYDVTATLAYESLDGRVRIKDICEYMRSDLSDEAVVRHLVKWLELDILLYDASHKSVSFSTTLTDDFEAPIRAAAKRAHRR